MRQWEGSILKTGARSWMRILE